MVLFYSRINWENYPSVVTPINEINLNKIDYAAKTLDERTVELYNTKAEKSVVLNTVSDWSLDEETGIITIKKVNGEVINFDLNIEKIPVNFELSEDGILIMTTDDGSIFKANIGEMIPVFSFENSETISFAKRYNRTVIATDFSSYEYEILEPFKGKLIATVVTPENSEMIPAIDQFDVMYTLKDGLTYHTTGKSTEKEIFISINENVSKITITSLTENNIISLEIDDSKEIVYKAYVKDGSIKDKHLEENYLANIRTYAENANLSETESSNSAKESKSYAVGGTGTREGEDTDNAKYYMQEAKRAAQSGGGGGGSIDLPVSIDNGGTGATTAKEAQYNLLNDMETTSYDIVDDSDFVLRYTTSASATRGTVFSKKAPLVWNYIKSKISSVLGLSETGLASGKSIGGITTISTSTEYNTTGNPTYLLMFDVTTWYNSTTTNQAKSGFTGQIYSTRNGGNLQDHVANIQMAVSYKKATVEDGTYLLLRTDNSVYQPCIIKDTVNNKYYLSLRITGFGGRNIRLHGVFTGTYVGTKLNSKDSTGTLPDGYEMAISGYKVITAGRATADANGNNIASTYATKEELNNIEGITIVNNLLATVEGNALDAVQGKVLNDKITDIETKQGNCYLKYENNKFYIGYDDNTTEV